MPPILSRLARYSAALFLLAAGLRAPPAAAHNPNALWDIVHGQCVPHAKEFHSPLPCTSVNRDGGYAILKDLKGATQFLLIPTARVTGIEDPAILAPDAPNYWQAAWAARGNVEALANRALPRDDLALAINSIDGRSQNQLHIHIDCIRADVRDALRSHAADIGPHWAPFPEPLAGQKYQAMRIAGSDLAGIRPFRLLADGLPQAKAAMGLETLVVTGTILPDGQPGFYLLAGRADPQRGDPGSGERLQDHACALAHAP